MKRIVLAALLMASLFSSAVDAATITSWRDGDWNEDRTWNGGKVPGSGDTAVIATRVSLNGTRTIYPAVQIGNGGVLEINGVITHDALPTTAKFTVSGTGVMRIKGKLLIGSNGVAGGTVSYTGIDVTSSTATLEMIGTSNGGGEVTALDFADNPSGNTSLVVSVNRPPTTATTHVRVTSGPMKNAIWPISAISGNKITIDHALVQGSAVGVLAWDSDDPTNPSAVDSISVLDAVITPDEVYWIGATLIQEEDTHVVGRIEKVFNNSSTSNTAVFVDTDDNWIDTNGSDLFIVTYGIYPGITLEYMTPAVLRLGPEKPTTAYHVPNGNVNTGAGEGLNIRCDGIFNIQYGAVVWGTGPSGGVIQTDERVDTDWFWNYALFIENLGQNIIDFRGENGAMLYIDRSFCYDMLGPDNGDFGHFARVGDGNTGAPYPGNCVTRGTNPSTGGGIHFTNFGFLKGQDDLIYASYHGKMYVEDSWVMQNRSGNGIDLGCDGDYYVKMNRVEGWGVGENLLQLDNSPNGAILELEVNDILSVSGGNAAMRNIVDSHNVAGGFSNCQGFMGLSEETFPDNSEINNVEIRWSNWWASSINYNSSNHVTLNNWTLENCGYHPDSGGYAIVTTSSYAGGVEFSGTAKAQVNNWKILNMWRRGWSIGSANWNTNLNRGIICRGSSRSLEVNFNGVVWNEDQSQAEGLTLTTNAYGYAMHLSDGDWAGTELLGLEFKQMDLMMDTSALQVQDLTISGTFWGGTTDPFYGVMLKSTGNHLLKGVQIKASPGNTRYPFRFLAGADCQWENCTFYPTSGSLTYCVYGDQVADIGTGNGNIVIGGTQVFNGGVGVQTIATLEATYGWTNSVDGTIAGQLRQQPPIPNLPGLSW